MIRLDAKLPKKIASKMKAWRAGFERLRNTGYIEYHERAARDLLPTLASEYRLRIHSTEMVSDGWLDGMRVLSAVVETKSGALLKLKWHDSHGCGSWMKRCPSGGHSTLFDSDLD
jgi:hypothetical protein